MPGPGDNEYKPQTNSGCTIGAKFSDYKTDEFPGPRAYDIVKIFVEAVDIGDVGKWRQKLI